MNFTVVIPTFNAECFIHDLLTPFVSCGIQNQVFIIDSSSSDNTVSMCTDLGFSNIVVIPQSDFDHGGTRSLFRKYCQTELVVFMTQDARLESVRDLYRLLEVFDDKAVGAAFGRQLPHADADFFGSHLRYFNYGDKSYKRVKADARLYGVKTAQLSNSFAAYRVSSLNEVNWFKSNLILGEDVYVGAKLLDLGYALAYVSEARVFHSHNYSLSDDFRRYFDIGVFHAMEKWILDDYGSASGEGIRYIESELKSILTTKRYALLGGFFMRNALKFLGYKLGKNYKMLPAGLISFLSMHHRWWLKQQR